MACASARAMFLCGGQTLSVSLRSTARSPFCRLPATSSPGRGKSFEGKPLVKWSGEPLPAAPIGAATSPEGGGLGKTGRSCPRSLTAERIQLLSCKLFALAKASPFRERWHGEAVTERVASGTNPLSLAALDSSPEGRALGRTGEFRPPFVNGRKKSADKR